MNRILGTALTGLVLCVLLAGGAGTSAAAPDDDVKKARKELKKNLKKLAKIQKFLAQQDQAARESGNAAVRDKAAEAIDQLCQEQLGDVLDEIGAADDADAAEALVEFGVFVPHDGSYERIVRTLRRFRDDGAVDYMAGTLAADLAGGKGKKRRKKGDDAAWKAQVLVADVFHELEHPGAIEPLALQISKGTLPAVVNACVAAAEYKEDHRIVSALIELLGRVEKVGGWEYHNVRQRLTQLTGQDFFTQEKWKGWWGANGGEAWDPSKKGEAKEAATRERGPAEQIPSFFGSEIESNRLVFVIDTSGSMEMTDRPEDFEGDDEKYAALNPDDPKIKATQRIERAKAAAIAAIEKLGPTQSFNVIGFAETNKLWKPAVVPATPENKKAAIEFCRGLVEDGGTHTGEAIAAAFADPAIDTIYLLSDGAPMKKVGNPGEQQKQFAEEEIRKVLYMVRELNRFRRVKINTFGMDGAGVYHKKWGPRPVTLPTEPEFLAPLQQFLRDLASMTGGIYKSI